MKLTAQLLKASVPKISSKNNDKYSPWLIKYLDEYNINTPLRLAHFLAQVGHETLDFIYYRELASGEAYDTGTLAIRLGNTPQAEGDGQKYKGRGCIQITGRANYLEVSMFIFNDKRLLDHPELLELPQYGVLAACWFWTKHNLNSWADADNCERISRIINGGTNGLADRKTRLLTAKKALNLAA